MGSEDYLAPEAILGRAGDWMMTTVVLCLCVWFSWGFLVFS